MVLCSFAELSAVYDRMREAAAEVGGCSVVLLLSPAPDSLAAAKLFTEVLKSDGLSYLIRPLKGFEDLEHVSESVIRNNDEIRSVVMINCGGQYPLDRVLELTEDQTVYVLDAHRPIYHLNIHSEQIWVIDDGGLDFDAVPDVDDEVLVQEGGGEDDDDADADDERGDSEDDAGLSKGDDDDDDDDDEGEAEFGDNEDGDKSVGSDDDDDEEDEAGDKPTEPSTPSQAPSVVPPTSPSAAPRVVPSTPIQPVSPSGSHATQPSTARSPSPSKQQSLGKRKRGRDDDDDDDDDDEHDGGGGGGGQRGGAGGRPPRQPADDDSGDGGSGSDDDDDEEGRRHDAMARTSHGDSPQTAHRRRRFFQYYDGDFFGLPSSYLMYQLAEQKNRARNDLLWLAVVGVTDAYLSHQLGRQSYSKLYSDLHKEVKSKNLDERDLLNDGLGESDDDDDDDDDDDIGIGGGEAGGARRTKRTKKKKTSRHEGRAPAGKDGRIEAVQEYQFMLHRHWSLYDAICHSGYVATRLGIGNRGRTAVADMLAKMGVSLRDSKEKFVHMQSRTQRHFVNKLEALGPEFNMEDVRFPSFQRGVDFRPVVSAPDVCYSVRALLECSRKVTEDHSGGGGGGGGGDDGGDDATTAGPLSVAPHAGAGAGDDRTTTVAGRAGDGTAGWAANAEVTWRDNFWDAYAALDGKYNEVLVDGFRHAIVMQQAVVRLAADVLHLPASIGFMRVLQIDDMADRDRSMFTQPLALCRLGRYILNIKRKAWSKHPKPFVIAALDGGGEYTVVGLPFAESDQFLAKTKFTEAFQLAADNTEVTYSVLGFESNMIRIGKRDYQRFITFLQTGLE